MKAEWKKANRMKAAKWMKAERKNCGGKKEIVMDEGREVAGKKEDR